MANVKLTEKKLLEKVQAKLVLLIGKKISQQEILDKCIKFSDHNFDQFIKNEFDSPKITKKLINEIISNTVRSGYHYPEKSNDELIYGI